MSQRPRLTDDLVKGLQPSTSARIVYDGDPKAPGFGLRITPAGVKSFVLRYRTKAGQERKIAIGRYPAWGAAGARDEAKRLLKEEIWPGRDPLAEIQALREAPTVNDLFDRFEKEHLPRLRKATADDYHRQITKYIRPELGKRKLADVSYSAVDKLHRKIVGAGHPYQANRVLATLSKAFNTAIRWQWITTNPCQGIEKAPEESRERYLTADEFSRLTTALAAHPDQQVANVIRLLLLTGCRRGEALSARWEDFDLGAGTWTKPSAHTKQKKIHRAPLSAPARLLLSDLREQAPEDATYVFPGRDDPEKSLTGLKRSWRTILKAAGITGLRIHDLRHSYASTLVNSGASLPLIGALLGHTQVSTTARYAHLLDDPMRAATELAGQRYTDATTPKPADDESEVVDLAKARGR